MSTSWVTRWKYVMSLTPTKPGIWRLREGGYFVRAKYGSRALHEATFPEAIAIRAELTRPAPIAPPRKTLFSVFAVSLFEERVLKGKIDSAATRERWNGTLTDYLIPEFGLLAVDEVTHNHIVKFTVEIGRWIKKGKPSLKKVGVTVHIAPSTANGWLRIMRTICNKMTVRFDLPRNPFDGIEFFPEGRVYSNEEPNSLSPDQVKGWLRLAREMYPQHYAMMVLGFVTGRRPGELRALRKTIDVLWMKRQVLIRRSHSRGTEIRDNTKTGKDLVLNLPQEVMDILKQHMTDYTGNSELLFPSTIGGIRSRSALDKPFAAIAAAMKLKFHLSPRGMRRSFQDLAREAQIESLVTRSISGHATETMQDHYSTVRENEQRAAMDKVLRLVR